MRLGEAGDAVTALCRSCEAPIYWARTEVGKAIPLDADATGRPLISDNANLVATEGGEEFVVCYVPPGEGAFVAHFSTCPFAGSHRRR